MNRIVRKDENGFYIQHDRFKYRPHNLRRKPVGLKEGMRVWCSASFGQAGGRLTFSYVWGKRITCFWIAKMGDPLYDMR